METRESNVKENCNPEELVSMAQKKGPLRRDRVGKQP